MIKKTVMFFKSVWQELKYVSWPSTVDLKEGTSVVIAMSIFVAVFLALVDFIFRILIQNLLLKG